MSVVLAADSQKKHPALKKSGGKGDAKPTVKFKFFNAHPLNWMYQHWTGWFGPDLIGVDPGLHLQKTFEGARTEFGYTGWDNMLDWPRVESSLRYQMMDHFARTAMCSMVEWESLALYSGVWQNCYEGLRLTDPTEEAKVRNPGLGDRCRVADKRAQEAFDRFIKRYP